VVSDPTPSPVIQYAALPWRRVKGEIQVLLITTRNTRRWIVPKGWPLDHMSPGECAAHEALEEAGVSGTIADMIGSFRHDKRRKTGELAVCEVQVFPLEVLRRQRSWPEKRARETCWCSVAEAVALVAEPGLGTLIETFAEALRHASIS
jgi:8-oxo-dGTP pyrophosphatase MutT (NUDIX family)